MANCLASIPVAEISKKSVLAIYGWRSVTCEYLPLKDESNLGRGWHLLGSDSTKVMIEIVNLEFQSHELIFLIGKVKIRYSRSGDPLIDKGTGTFNRNKRGMKNLIRKLKTIDVRSLGSVFRRDHDCENYISSPQLLDSITTPFHQSPRVTRFLENFVHSSVFETLLRWKMLPKLKAITPSALSVLTGGCLFSSPFLQLLRLTTVGGLSVIRNSLPTRTPIA